MAVETIENLMTVPGSLCINPTNLSLAFPHGGTSLGYVDEKELLPGMATAKLTAEEFGIMVVEELDLGRSWVYGAIVRGWDDDAYSTLFPGTSTGLSSGRTFVSETKTSPRQGLLLSANSVILCFSPDDLARHKMVVFHQAIPKLAETASINQKLRVEERIACVFQAIPNTSNNRYVDWGLQEDITAL